MKKLFLTIGLAAITAVGFSQELILDEIDEFTGNIVKATKHYRVGKTSTNSLYMAARRVNDSYGIEFWSTADQGCAGAIGNYVILLGANGEKLKLEKDISDVDCADNASSVYVFDVEQDGGLVISKIRFAQSDSFDDFEYVGEYTLAQILGAVQ